MMTCIEELEQEVSIQSHKDVLTGTLIVPQQALGLILFAHDSGSRHLNQRDRHMAKRLQEAGFATLLFNMLTNHEEIVDQYTHEFRFDIALLSTRLQAVARFAHQALPHLRVGYYGASASAAACLITAAESINGIEAMVARGGRPDLAGACLAHVQVPSLFIVGGLDEEVIELNQWAQKQMRCKTKLEIIPGARHLFSEPGKFDVVAKLTKNWFLAHF